MSDKEKNQPPKQNNRNLARRRNKREATARRRLSQEEYQNLVEVSLRANKTMRGSTPKGLHGASASRVGPVFDVLDVDDMIKRRNTDLQKKLPDQDRTRFQFNNRSVIAKVYHDIIAQCRNAYRNHGIVRNVVDLLSNYISKVHIYHEDPKIRQFYQAWAARIQLNERINVFTHNLLVHGQVFIYRTMAKITDADKREMRKLNTSFGRDQKSLLIAHKKGEHYVVKPQTIEGFAQGNIGTAPKSSKNRVPWSYKSLNPLQLEPTGGIFDGESKWRFLIKEEDIARLGFMRNNIIQEQQSERLPKDWQGKLIKRDSNVKFDDADYDFQVPLKEDQIYIIFDKGKFDWDDWAIPFIFPALKDLALKDILRQMEARSAKSVMTSVMKATIGRISEGFFPPEGAVEQLAEMVAEPGEATHVIWATDDLDMEFIQPDLSKIFDNKKHEGVNQDILTSLGAAEVVITGKGGGNFSNAFLSVSAMLERLDNIREKLRLWLMHELKIVADAMGFKKLPSVTFERTSLRDKRAQDDFMTKLLQMGIISKRTILEYAEIDPEAEFAELKRERDDIAKGDLPVSKGPFKNAVEDALLTEQMRQNEDNPMPSREEELEQRLKEQEAQQKLSQKFEPKQNGAPKPGDKTTKTANPQGRPPGINTPQSVKRDTKPKGMSSQVPKQDFESIKSIGVSIIQIVEDELYQQIFDTTGIAKDELEEEVHDRVFDMILKIVSNTPPHTQVDGSYVGEMQRYIRTEAPAKLDRCVADVMRKKLADFRKKNGSGPSSEKRKEMLSSAFAICNTSLKK